MASKTVLNRFKPSYVGQVWCPECAPRKWLPRVLASSLQLLECAGTSRPKFQHRCNPYNDPSPWVPLSGFSGPPFSCRIRLQGTGKTLRSETHLLCRESYHLGSHFGTSWGWIGWVLEWFKTVFLVILGLLEFVKNSHIKPLWGNVLLSNASM